MADKCDHVWFRGRVPGAWVEIRASVPDLKATQIRFLLRIVRMVESWVSEDELRAGPEDSCIERGGAP